MGIDFNTNESNEKDKEEKNSINKYQILEQIHQIKENPFEPKKVINLEFNYIYFIVNHEKTNKIKIYLTSEYKGADTLEKIEEIINDSSISIIYRFKSIPEFLKKNKENKKYEVLVIAKEEKK